jgi:hypothetical protein
MSPRFTTTTAIAALAVGASCAGQAAPTPAPSSPLELRADDVRSDLLGRITARGDAGDDLSPEDPFRRSRTALDLRDIDPSLRLEFGSASAAVADPHARFDGLTATERAERGLAPSDNAQVYDASLRFDAARIGAVVFMLRSGVRGALAGAGDVSDPASSLLLDPVAGAGLEWRPSRDLFVAGSSLFSVDDRGGAVAEIIAELGVRVTSGLSVSLGYRTLDTNFEAPSDAAEDLRDAAFAAIRLRF